MRKPWAKFPFGRKKEIPAGLYIKCEGCGEMVFKKQVEEKLRVCPACNYHFRLSARQRIDFTLDQGSFQECDADMTSGNPLEFTDLKTYPDRLKEHQERSGLKEAALIGHGRLEGKPIIFGVIDFAFLAGSMGSVVGEKITRAIEMAIEERKPLVIVSGGGGGARMMEGVFSLAQMSKTSAALARLDDADGLYISVMTDPTMGGIAASFASLGDVIIAEPGALLGFSGPRTMWHAVKMKLPEGFQTSEFLLEHGFLDMVVNRSDLKPTLSRLLDYLPVNAAPESPGQPDQAQASSAQSKNSHRK